MTTILLSMLFFLLAVAGLGLGVLLKRRPLQGSCGNCSDCLIRRAGS